LWSPGWGFDEATFERTAGSFDNPDFVDVVVQSYRHRFGYAPGDRLLDPIEQSLARQPDITVPTAVLHGGNDGVTSAVHSSGHKKYFSGSYLREVVSDAGHNLPQESPEVFSMAVLDLLP